MASQAHLDIYQGDDYAGFVLVENDDGTEADLSGYTARAQIRTDVADIAPEVIAELTITFDLPNTILLSLSHDLTKTFTQDYVWDLELTDAAGIVGTLMNGDVRVELEVTRTATVAA